MKKSLLRLKNVGRKQLFVGILAATLLFSSGVAFAYTSLDFNVKATQWANTNCNNPTSVGNQRAFFCYLWHKNTEQQEQIDAQTATNTTQQGQISTFESRVQILEDKNTPEILNIFPENGCCNHMQESTIINPVGRSFIYFEGTWVSGQGGFNIYYSDNGEDWIHLDALAGNSNNPNYRAKLIPVAHPYYKVIVINNFTGKLTGFIQ